MKWISYFLLCDEIFYQNFLLNQYIFVDDSKNTISNENKKISFWICTVNNIFVSNSVKLHSVLNTINYNDIRIWLKIEDS